VYTQHHTKERVFYPDLMDEERRDVRNPSLFYIPQPFLVYKDFGVFIHYSILE